MLFRIFSMLREPGSIYVSSGISYFSQLVHFSVIETGIFLTKVAFSRLRSFNN